MTISLKADAGGTFGEILVNGSQVAKFTPGGNAVIAGLVGTVSQSGGVPTGAVIERGSNANGNFIKFADGTLVCYRSDSVTTLIDLITASAVWFFGDLTVTFPETFISTGGVAVMHTSSSNGVITTCGVVSISTTDATLRFMTGTSIAAVPHFISYVAIGRWF